MGFDAVVKAVLSLVALAVMLGATIGGGLTYLLFG